MPNLPPLSGLGTGSNFKRAAGGDVKTFTYLDSIINEHGGSDAYVEARIGKARAAYLQLKNICNSKQLSVKQHQCRSFQYKCQNSSTVLGEKLENNGNHNLEDTSVY
ncbi:unnamed protein product [Schistosoma margrebowiei]|uniref:Uncharacterized protein n=1 Tax=Schistosoma margrebowiei TaxID=48269 RepID=A0A183LEY8_9TREM|nr:unnamed protein product [Schistosoma margrebowiei]